MAMLDSNLDQLLQDVIDLFSNKTKFVQPESIQSTIPLSKEISIGFQAPIKGSYANSGGFSPNAPTDARHTKGHKGVDLRAAGGTAVFPIADGGIVSNVGANSIGGNTVSIVYPGEIKTYYAHLGTATVHKGDKVDKNTPVGTVGDSGNAKGTAPHIHVQVWQNNQLQNPGKFFSVPKYTNLQKDEKLWMSEQTKKDADSFNMNKHLSSRQQAFASSVNTLVKISEEYYKLASKL